ncbi:MAG: SHOCT domain-containing protein, partial [Desulfatitalea sp.]|nr:SHOCT domain-containing protein [Desulfatitalea sp.]
EGLFKSIALAYTILILHVLLIAGLGLVVLFFGGLVQNLVWIVLGGMLVLGLSGYLFYRRMRREGRSLGEALRSPMFQGRAVEISFLGGMASFRLGPPISSKALEGGYQREPMQLELEDPERMRIRDIAALGQLLEKNLITPEEFTAAKRRLLGG